jgi:hypothetical protein
MKPDLKSQNYGKAIELCIILIDLALAPSNSKVGEIYGKYGNGVSSDTFYGGNDRKGGNTYLYYIWKVFVLFGIIGIVWIASYYQKMKFRSLDRGRVALERLMREIDNTESSNRFSATSCPICLEEFPTRSLPDGTNSELDISGDLSTMQKDTETSYGSIAKLSADPMIPTAPLLPSSDSHTHSTSSHSSSASRPMSLGCGHVFCFSCLEIVFSCLVVGQQIS